MHLCGTNYSWSGMYTTSFWVGFSDFVCTQIFLEMRPYLRKIEGKKRLDRESSGFEWMWPHLPFVTCIIFVCFSFFFQLIQTIDLSLLCYSKVIFLYTTCGFLHTFLYLSPLLSSLELIEWIVFALYDANSTYTFILILSWTKICQLKLAYFNITEENPVSFLSYETATSMQ